MKVSYLVTYCNEVETLDKLLNLLVEVVSSKDQVLTLGDESFGSNNLTNQVLEKYKRSFVLKHGKSITDTLHPLNKDYGTHKNFGIEKCTGDFIFQIDGDELPPESLLGENLHALLESNPGIEAYAVPRINDFRGVTPEHAKQWGWALTESPTYKRPIVNFPDYQWRIFKRDPRITFTRRLHEKIEGYHTFVVLPAEEDYALYHDKTIETQIKTNLRYNTTFTPDENRGHGAK